MKQILNLSRIQLRNYGLKSVHTRKFGTQSIQNLLQKTQERIKERRERNYYWIEPEAESLIKKAYERHKCLSDKSRSFPPALDVKDLESLEKPFHFKPESVSDKVAQVTVHWLEKLMYLFFREKYDHHALTLETVAAVPGTVASASRHFRSLRRMKRDHGWISALQEEAENERMHLLIWMQHTKPHLWERGLVMCAQIFYTTFYTSLYAISPKTAHRATGYLEEAAHAAYTDYLDAIDTGNIKNVPAMSIAKKYYDLPEDAMLRDVVLHVRADECMHRDYNHHLANMHKDSKQDEEPNWMK
eukprot:snap_masked-scaffold_11-processed-gene-8.4-mRNA-1 protein AED:0.03 eAED:0.04 QI:0/-1/0/1/-1/1/1/0/300